jgi:hypothetical protein
MDTAAKYSDIAIESDPDSTQVDLAVTDTFKPSWQGLAMRFWQILCDIAQRPERSVPYY